MAIVKAWRCDGCKRLLEDDEGLNLVWLGGQRREFCQPCSAHAFWATACELTKEQAEALMRGFEARRVHGVEVAQAKGRPAGGIIR